MKKFLTFCFLVAIVVSLCLPVLADDETDSSIDSGTSVTENEASYPSTLTKEDLETGEWAQTGVSVYVVNPVDSSDATGLKKIVLSLIGEWDSIIVEYQYMNTNSSYYSYLREVQLDYPWLCSCAIFLVVIFCVFRAGGSLLCKK